MALIDLIDTLEAEGEAELARQHDRDAAEAEGIRAAARAEAERIRAAAVAAVEAERHRTSVVTVGRARAGVAARLRDERERALAAVHAAAGARLSGLRDEPGYDDVLGGLLREALAVLPDAAVVRVDPRDAARVERALGAGLRDGRRPPRVVADLHTDGGVVVGGRGREVDNTVETRLDAAWPALRTALARTWAGRGTGSGAGP